MPAELTQAGARKWIRNTLARYKGLDEDARIAFLGLDVCGLPKAIGYPVDFKPAWGLLPPQADTTWRTTSYEVPKYFPTSIKPSAQDVEDIFQLVCFGRPISTWLPTPPTWEFQRLSKEYVALQAIVNTRISPGLGELVWDGVTPLDLPVHIACYAKDNRAVYVSPDMQCLVNLAELKKRYPNVTFDTIRQNGPHFILFTRGLLNPSNIAYARQIFYSGAFPVARFDKLETLDAKAIVAQYKAQNSKKQQLYQMIFEG
jgi:hypothetical protein